MSHRVVVVHGAPWSSAAIAVMAEKKAASMSAFEKFFMDT
jgi:hypothetical protein